MAFINYVTCPLYDLYTYQYPIVLEEDTFTLQFIYNDIMKLYTLSIFDAQGFSICSGIGLTPYHPIIADYDLRGLTGFFQMLPIGEQDVEYYKLYPEDISKYYKFYYYFE